MLTRGQRIAPSRAGTVIRESATCANCTAPLEKSFGRWVHHWLYRGACTNPTAVEGSEQRSGD